MKTAIAIIVAFGLIITLVVYGTREALKNQQPKYVSRIPLNTQPPKIVEKVKVIERIKVVKVPVTTIREIETVEKVVYIPEKAIVKEIHREPASAPVPQHVTCPVPQSNFIPATQTIIIIPAMQPLPRIAYYIPSPRRSFHPPIASRGYTPEINRVYNHYRAVRPNYRRY